MRLLVMSDIHGFKGRFVSLLEKAGYDPLNDKLVLLGDYIDRGPDPVGVLLKVMELVSAGAVALKGNHEQMFLDAFDELKTGKSDSMTLHNVNGGEITWKRFSSVPAVKQSEILAFIRNLPFMHITGKYVFVHAGLNSGISLEKQDTDTLLWSREEFIYGPGIAGRIVVFGHTPTVFLNHNGNIWYGNGKIGIDCGAAHGGRLACLELPGRREYYG